MPWLPIILYLDVLKIRCQLINGSFIQKSVLTKGRRCLLWFKPRERVFILLEKHRFQALNIKTPNLFHHRNIQWFGYGY